MFDGEKAHAEEGMCAGDAPLEGGARDEGGVRSGDLEILYDKKFVCPLCETAFTSKKIRSRYIKPVRLESDFCQVFEQGDPNPLHYYVMVCPVCSYGFYEDSSRIANNVRGELESFLKDWRSLRTKSYCQERSLFDVIETYRLTLALADIVREIHFNHAGLNIRLAWLFRGQQDGIKEKEYLERALSHFEQSYISSDFMKTNTSEMQLLYMIGELHRRLKNFAEAIRYFGLVVFHEDKSRFRKFVNLARDQWTLAREEHMRENNGQTDLKDLGEETP